MHRDNFSSAQTGSRGELTRRKSVMPGTVRCYSSRACVHKQVDGWSALFYATDQGHLDIVKYLLKHGADVSLTSKVSASKP